jgi:hypothetical protein
VNLYFQPDAQLTTQDRMVLDILQKDYERHQNAGPARKPRETSSDEEEEEEIKHTRFDSASPEGMRILDLNGTHGSSRFQTSKKSKTKPSRT